MPRIISTIALASAEDGPILFCKLDIKDGFWRMCVPEDQEHQFCYVLPPTPDDKEPMIVVPAALQVGWVSSPPDFCTATETARDVAEALRAKAAPGLPPHPMEADMVDAMEPGLRTHLPNLDDLDEEALQGHLLRFLHLFEVYVDDFIGLIQSTDKEVLQHHSRALLHAILITSCSRPPNTPATQGKTRFRRRNSRLNVGDSRFFQSHERLQNSS